MRKELEKRKLGTTPFSWFAVNKEPNSLLNGFSDNGLRPGSSCAGRRNPPRILIGLGLHQTLPRPSSKQPENPRAGACDGMSFLPLLRGRSSSNPAIVFGPSPTAVSSTTMNGSTHTLGTDRQFSLIYNPNHEASFRVSLSQALKMIQEENAGSRVSASPHPGFRRPRKTIGPKPSCTNFIIDRNTNFMT